MGVDVLETVPIWLRLGLAPTLRELPLLRWDRASNWKETLFSRVELNLEET